MISGTKKRDLGCERFLVSRCSLVRKMEVAALRSESNLGRRVDVRNRNFEFRLELGMRSLTSTWIRKQEKSDFNCIDFCVSQYHGGQIWKLHLSRSDANFEREVDARSSNFEFRLELGTRSLTST